MQHTAFVRNRWHRVATTSVFVANGLAFGTWAAELPRLKEAHGLSDSALGVLLLIMSIGSVAIMPVTSWLAARIGTARLAASAGLLVAVALALPSLAPSWLALAGGCAALGTLLGCMDVSMNGHASAVETAWGAAIMSSFHAGWSFGGLAGASLAGVLASAGIGLTLSYAAPAILVAALAVPALTLRRAGTTSRGPALALPSRAILAVAVIAGLCFMAEGAVADWSGVYLRSELGSDAAWAAAAYGFFAFAMAFGRLGGDLTVRRLGPVVAVRGGAGLAALGLGVMLAIRLPVAVDVGMAMMGLGLSNIVPVAFSAAGRLMGTNGIAMCATMGYAGFMSGPPVIGSLADVAGLRVALLLVLGGMLAMALAAGAVARRPAPVQAGSV